jgi:hypothetical protein
VLLYSHRHEMVEGLVMVLLLQTLGRRQFDPIVKGIVKPDES